MLANSVVNLSPAEQEAEAECIRRARECLNSNWELGRLAAEWTSKHARGRGDADFAELVECDDGTIRQARSVWQRFGISYSGTKLSWTHFRAALAWDDAEHWLQQAEELELSVADMRRMRGMTLPADSHDEPPGAQEEEQEDEAEQAEEQPPAPKRRGPRKPKATDPDPPKAAKTDNQPKLNITEAMQVMWQARETLNGKERKSMAKQLRELADQMDPPRYPDEKFPPSVEMVRQYCRERNNAIDPDQFVDFYTSKGWLVGKNRMKDWRACVRTWEKERTNGGGSKAASRFKVEGRKYEDGVDVDYTKGASERDS